MSDLVTTLRQRKIYTLLINPENPKRPRTQADVAKFLELKRERVSEAAAALEKKGFIRRLDNSGNNILYRRGPNAKIIEVQIAASYLEDGDWFDCYGRAFRPPQLAGGPGHEPYNPVWRTHLNGGWIRFNVLQEGELHFIDWKDGNGHDLRQALFPQKEARPMPGQVNYYTSLTHEGALIQMRYQRTANHRYLYMIPGDIKQTAGDLDDTDLSPFMRYLWPVLAWMEKYGGWRFLKKENSNEYVHHASVRKEFSADELTSQIIAESLGDDYGDIGNGPVWLDKSVPGGEAEFSRAEYAQVLSTLPAQLRRMDNNTAAQAAAFESRLTAIERQQLAILAILEREQQINDRLAERLAETA